MPFHRMISKISRYLALMGTADKKAADGFIHGSNGGDMRYLELRAAFETIRAVINKLEYHQSFAVKNGELKMPDVAYV